MQLPIFSMKLFCVCLTVLLIICLECETLTFLSKSEQNITLQVTTTNGVIQGRERRTIKRNKYFSFEGIPFARPPINDLRFRSPRAVKNWKGVLNATGPTEGCIEMKLRYLRVELEGTEDCLYMNVYVPKNRQLSQDGLLPVIFWIFGGAFLEGRSNLYGPDNLLDNNLVVVTFNYRLGVFGFLSTEDEASPGNYGLKDQNAALQWVNKNIEKFGGDPKKVTIAGQSAGGCSVMHHMLSPRSRGLFSRAIAWSGETTAVWSKQKNPKTIASDIAMSLGIETDNTTEMVEELRKVDFESLTNAQIMVVLVHASNIASEGIIFAPNIEPKNPDAFLTEDTYDLLKRGDLARVPLMIGMTTMEFGFFIKVIYAFRSLISLLFDTSSSSIPNGGRIRTFLENREIGKKIKEKYFSSKTFSGSTNDELTQYFSDLLFTVPIINTVRLVSPYIPVYFWVSSCHIKEVRIIFEAYGYPIDLNAKGVMHGEDLSLIWNYNHFRLQPKYSSIRNKFTQMWKNFADTGNPTPVFDPKLGVIWPRVTDDKNISHLLIEDNMKIGFNYKRDIIEFWEFF